MTHKANIEKSIQFIASHVLLIKDQENLRITLFTRISKLKEWFSKFYEEVEYLQNESKGQESMPKKKDLAPTICNKG